MTTAVATADRKAPTLAQLIEQMKPEIAKVLPAQLKPERMARIATTVIRQTPALARTTPESFLGALLTASQLGLEPGGVKPGCYFVPYGNVCTFIPSWFGLVDLARRSGQVVDVWAEIVYENDTFVYTLGLNRTIGRHDPPPLGEDRGKPIGVYAAAELVTGGKPFVVMTVAEVEAIRKQSRAGKNGPWVTHWEAMARKTAVRQLCKWLPASAELNAAITLDGSVRTDVGALVNAQPDYVDGEVADSEPPAIEPQPDAVFVSHEQIAEITALLAKVAGPDEASQLDWLAAWRAPEDISAVGDLTAEEAVTVLALLKKEAAAAAP